MHGDNGKAFQALAKAFEANPKLRHDSYTTGLATTITGRSLDVTLEMLEPSIERGTGLLRREHQSTRAWVDLPAPDVRGGGRAAEKRQQQQHFHRRDPGSMRRSTSSWSMK